MEEANNNNVVRMLQESIGPIFAFDNRQADIPTETDAANDEVWQALADSRISLSFSALLKLVPRFTEKVATLLVQKNAEQVSVNYSQPSNGLTIMDEQSPSIKVIIRGQEVDRTIVDRGLRNNVINKTTYDKLGITKWEACPFWLRMMDTRTVRPLGLIRPPMISLELPSGRHVLFG